MVAFPCRQALFSATAVRLPPEDVSCAGACRRYVTRFPSGVQMGNWLLSSDINLVELPRARLWTHTSIFAPDVMKASWSPVWRYYAATSYGRLGAVSGSLFPCRSTHTRARSSTSERPATYASSPLADDAYCVPSRAKDAFSNGDRRSSSDLQACQIERDGHQRSGRGLNVDEMTGGDVVAGISRAPRARSPLGRSCTCTDRSSDPGPVREVNRTARPPGNTCGDR